MVQVVLMLGMFLIKKIFGEHASEVYYQQAMLMNGIGGMVAFLILYPHYRNDEFLRWDFKILDEKDVLPFRAIDGFFLLFIGTALSMCANFMLNFFGEFLHVEKYSETMDLILGGKTFLLLILFVGILGPIAEEMVFRWLVYLRLRDYLPTIAAAVLSAVIFGIYHGNLTQFVYASIMGIVFALVLEWTGSIYSSMFLHIGANCWSLFFGEYGTRMILGMNPIEVLGFFVLIFLILIVGISFYYRIGKGRKRRI